jgi:hypothetical protein
MGATWERHGVCELAFRSLSTETLSEQAELGHTGTLCYQAF